MHGLNMKFEIYGNTIYLTGMYFRQDRTSGHKCQWKDCIFLGSLHSQDKARIYVGYGAFVAVMIHIVVSWIMTLFSVEVKPEDGASGFLHNNGLHLQDYSVWKPEKALWLKPEPQFLTCTCCGSHRLPVRNTSLQQNTGESCSSVSWGRTFSPQCVYLGNSLFYKFLMLQVFNSWPFHIALFVPLLDLKFALFDNKLSLCTDVFTWLWHTGIKIILLDLFIAHAF